MDSFHNIVLDGAKDTHTITYKDTGTVLAPTLARHIEETYKLKSKQKDKHGQTLMSEFKYMVENEAPNDEGKSCAYFRSRNPIIKKSIGKNSNTTSSWPFMVPNTLFVKGCREPIDTLTKIWLRNMHTHSIIKCLFFPFYIIGKLQVCAIDIIEGIDFVISFNSNKDLQMFCAICNRDYHENVSLRGTDIIMNSDNEEESNDYGELSLKLTIHEPMKHLPLFSSRQPLHFLQGNKLLKQHMQSLLNLVSIQSSDGELDVHNTTILYSMKDNKYPSLEALEEAFNDETRITFVDLLPFSIQICTKVPSKDFYKRQMNGFRQTGIQYEFNKELHNTYLDICSLLIDCNGTKVRDTNQRFHKRKISMNTCLSNVTTELLVQKIIR